MSSLPFTTALNTAIGRFRVRVGLTDKAGAARVEDERIQEFLDGSASEYDAALLYVDAMLAGLAAKIKISQIPDSKEIVQINDFQAQFDAWTKVRTNLLTTVPTSTGLPVRRFGSLGAHPSDPRRC